MARSVRQQIIESLGNPTQEDSNVTRGRHALFGTLYLDREVVGGMQNFSIRESNGTTFIPNIGNDWLEPKFGMRQWSGDGSRFILRGRDLPRTLGLGYSNAYDLDFRFLPFVLRWHYNFQSVTGGKTFEDAMWTLHTVFITDYTIRIPDPNNMMFEDFTFIAKGLDFNDGGETTGNLGYLWGTGEPGLRGADPGANAPNNGQVGSGAGH